MMDEEQQVLEQAVRRAGCRVLELGREGFETTIKPDRSPVTSADFEADRLLKDALLGAFPDDGWLSEETADEPARLDRKRVWIIDPIDGTRYFMRGIPSFAISAALIEQGHPVVAAIFNPATDEFFSAARGRGVTLNGHPIHVTRPSSDRMTILVNPRAHDKGQFASYAPHAEIRPMGSIAYTLALVAAGRADATLNFERMNEWDIVAGAFLVEEAGGFAVNGSWRPFRFNQPDTTVLGTIAGGRAVRSALAAVVRRAS